MNIISNSFAANLGIDLLIQIITSESQLITKYGNIKFCELIKIQLYDHILLENRQIILKKMLADKEKIIQLKQILKSINGSEELVSWFFETDNVDYKSYILSQTNGKKEGRFDIYINSVVGIIIIFLMIYCIGPNIVKYIREKLYDTTEKYQIAFMITHVLSVVYIVHTYLIKRKTFSPKHTEHVYITKFKKLQDFVQNINSLYANDDFLSEEKNIISNDIDILKNDFLFGINELNPNLDELYKSHLLRLNTQTNLKIFESNFTKILQYVGLIDAYIRITELVGTSYCFPEFEKSTTPYLYIEQLTNPFFINNNDANNYIKNDVYLGSPNTMIITGPNNSGKTTFLHNTLIAIFLAQTLGVSCCKKIILTPFEILYSNLILGTENSSVGNPLIQSEFVKSMNTCYEYNSILESLDTSSFVFCAMDELVKGTVLPAIIENSQIFCERFAKYNNNLLCITTHNHQLTNLSKKYPNNIINKKFIVKKSLQKSPDDKSIPIYPFKLKNGPLKINQ